MIKVYNCGEGVDVSCIDFVNAVNELPDWKARVIYDYRPLVQVIYKSKPTWRERLRGCFT